MHYRMMLVCLYPSILMAGCGPSKEKPDILIEATLGKENSHDISHDFDYYHSDDQNQYARNQKHAYSIYAMSSITLGDATIEGKSAKIVYYVSLNQALFRDTKNAEIKINEPPKKFSLDDQGHYALLCAKTIASDKK